MNSVSPTRFSVLWITSWYPNPENPVAGIFVRDHARAVHQFDDLTLVHLMERQRSVHCLWDIEDIHSENEETDAAIRVRARQSTLPWTTFPIHLMSAMSGVRKLRTSGKKFDLVHAHTYRAGVPAALIAKQLHVPLIITEHSSIFPRRALHGFEYLKAAFAFRSAGYVLPVSQSLQHAIEKYGFQPRFQVIGNTFDPEIFYPPNQPIKRDHLQIVFVNQLTPLKGLALVLQALANVSYLLPEWKMQIIGGGPEKANMEALVNQSGLSHQVTFLGVTTKSRIADVLRSGDLFVLSSLHETFSASTLEALACGVPVLATACGGPEDFVTPKMGLLVQPGSLFALEQGLVQIISRLGDYDRTQIASEVHQKYRYEAIGEQIHAIYASVLSR